MSVCAVIPVYNHGAAITGVVQDVRSNGLICILVDDGSAAACAAVLDQLAAADPENVVLLRLATNLGKGGAVKAGLRKALELGFSHALQIDADGQHDAMAIPEFLRQVSAQPAALISGYPVYDASVPKGRLYARYLTHVWVWINTLSLSIKDSMCGFRIYPLLPTVQLLDDASLGNRMDFDVEIMVRLYWRGMNIVSVPTRVSYPSDGISHFRVLLDNVLISRMHALLFLGMLLRSPMLLWRNCRRWVAK